MAAAHRRDLELAEPEVNITLALVGGATLMPLDGGLAALGLVFRGENATMNAGSERLAQNPVLLVGMQSNPANQVGPIHEWKLECPEPFG